MKKLLLILLIVNCSLQIAHSQWTQLPNLPVSGTVYDMYFVNANTGWMTLTNLFYTLKTTNGGVNWVVQLSGTALKAGYLKFFNDTLGISLSSNSSNTNTIIKTTNGGENWTAIYMASGAVFMHMNFVNKDTGWVCGTDGFLGGVWQTTDGGVSFQRQMTSSTGSLDRIFFLKGKINGQYVGWTVAAPVLYKTVNSGLNWMQIYNGFTSQCGVVVDMHFLDSLNGVATRSLFCFSRTTNGGYNWVDINESNNILQARIAVTSNGTGWLTLASDSVIKTTNFFQTYGRQPSPVSINRIFAVDTAVVYGAYDQSSAIRTTNGGGPISGVNKISGEVPKEFVLYQNFPNPFNPVTKIKYQIPARSASGVKSSHVKLVVYDMLGREIEVLVNQNQAPGIYQVEWAPGELSSGVYFYTLQMEDFRETKKLTYVK